MQFEYAVTAVEDVTDDALYSKVLLGTAAIFRVHIARVMLIGAE